MVEERIRVLVADDEKTVCEELEGILLMDRTRNFEVEMVLEADNILPSVGRFKPHVVLLDNFFAEAELGIDKILPQIKGFMPEVRVIIITSKRGGQTRPIVRALGWQADDFLDKPFDDPDALCECVAKAYQHFLQQQAEAD
ncbi:MAG: response regulator [Gammaproteobacteria bacterium]|nr:response regulator [Gammaproteobacteria bacterium]